uniref:Uncharacterized protein n=1 Tax=Heterorhabditis bacteriophora TaxID=37862 RepID=A0A1I7XMI8_HETBA
MKDNGIAEITEYFKNVFEYVISTEILRMNKNVYYFQVMGANAVRRNSTELTRCTAESNASPIPPTPRDTVVAMEHYSDGIISSRDTVEDDTYRLIDSSGLSAAIANGNIKEQQFQNI